MKSFVPAICFALLSTALAVPIQERASGSGYTSGSTANDVQNGVCAPLTVIFARGTSEAGNIGTVIGPPMFKALLTDLGASKVALQGVAYPATASGNANLGADGGPTMAKLAKQALQQCPSTKVALSGYSQGAMVVHNALSSQGLSSSSISAIVAFGDPLDGQSFGSVPASKVKEYCASGDDVCEDHSGTITSAHLSYGSDANDAAQFLITTTGVS